MTPKKRHTSHCSMLTTILIPVEYLCTIQEFERIIALKYTSYLPQAWLCSVVERDGWGIPSRGRISGGDTDIN